MGAQDRTKSGDALTDLILTLFRVNNLVVTWGDRLVSHLGLTSSRWQILGAIVASDRPQPVAWIARDLGGNRQNVQRIVNDLAKEGLVEFRANPHHRRAQLVVLTAKGRQAFDAAIALYNPAVDGFTEGLELEDIENGHRIMLALRRKLEKLVNDDEP